MLHVHFVAFRFVFQKVSDDDSTLVRFHIVPITEEEWRDFDVGTWMRLLGRCKFKHDDNYEVFLDWLLAED